MVSEHKVGSTAASVEKKNMHFCFEEGFIAVSRTAEAFSILHALRIVSGWC